MEKIIFSPTYLSYKIINEKPQIHMYGRSKDKVICVIDESWRPYFLAILNDDNDNEEFCKRVNSLIIKKEGTPDAKVIKTEIIEKKLIGKKTKAIKIFVNIPAAVKTIRDTIKDWPVIKNLYEYDIPSTRRYLIDNEILPLSSIEVTCEQLTTKLRIPTFKAKNISTVENASPELNVIAFDIETYNPHGKSMNSEKFPILMIALYGKNYKKVLTWKKFKTDVDYIEFVDDEKTLLERFARIINELTPDILTGYYSDGFDLPYIHTRAKVNKIKLDIGHDRTEPKKIGRGMDIEGITHVDILNFIRIVVSRSLKTDSYSLNAVANELLDEEKDDIDINKLADTWDNNPDGLDLYAKYNLKDAILTYKLFEKLLPNIEGLQKLIGLTLYDITRLGFSQLDEWYIIRKCKEYNEIILNKPGYNQVNDRSSKRFQGAFVVEPTPGFYHNIAVFDFRSLYPSIIVTHNIGLSTLNCDCEDCKNHKVPGIYQWFCKNKKGFIPTILEEIINRRARIKEILKKDKNNILLKARSEALKLLANSFYGYLGFGQARWYCYECGNSVTAYGRYYIQDVIKQAEQNGFKVLYGDTDSIFLSLGNKTKLDALHFVDGINSELPGMMELDFEDHCPSGLFVAAKGKESGAKKRYALLRDDGSLKIRGFETVRRNVSIIAKEVQEKVLNIILKEEDIEKAKKYVTDIINDIKNNKINKDKLIITTMLTKPISEYESIGPHVAVASIMESKGYSVNAGSIIPYIITKGKGRMRDKAKMPQDAINIDDEYYINNQIIPVIEKIFDVFNISVNELEKSQSKLDSFF